MIQGLNKFKERFAGREHQYVIIGGTAAYLVRDEAGLEPRATQDLDMVLCLETMDAEFATVLWEFIEEAGYKNLQKSTEKEVFYRFYGPKDKTFPEMIELLSRSPDFLNPPEGMHIVPIPIAEDVDSLSAILLDDEYYHFLHAHKRNLDGVSIVTEIALIPLKAKAWLNLTEDKKKNLPHAKSKDINKHRTDVLRLAQLLRTDTKVDIPAAMKTDLENFLGELLKAEDLNLKDLKLGGAKLEDLISAIKKAYAISD